ncbi:MAG: hypothetical protein OEX02_20620, partial [Cyclobacteriaceae bacterium]|nr:hypothetical protein [Cyclobacteriaceae bacterium]
MEPNKKTIVVSKDDMDDIKTATKAASKSNAPSLGRSEKRASGASGNLNSEVNETRYVDDEGYSIYSNAGG